jgi:hypothetical protein
MNPWLALAAGIGIFVLFPLFVYIVFKLATLGILKAKCDFNQKG